jgi:hypothetical protein
MVTEKTTTDEATLLATSKQCYKQCININNYLCSVISWPLGSDLVEACEKLHNCNLI